MMGVLFIYMLSTLSSDIFIGTIKQLIKLIPYLTAITNSSHNYDPFSPNKSQLSAGLLRYMEKKPVGICVGLFTFRSLPT